MWYKECVCVNREWERKIVKVLSFKTYKSLDLLACFYCILKKEGRGLTLNRNLLEKSENELLFDLKSIERFSARARFWTQVPSLCVLVFSILKTRSTLTSTHSSSLHWLVSLSFWFVFLHWRLLQNIKLSVNDVIVSQKGSSGEWK